MTVKFLTGDALAVLRTLPSGSVQACITSPPYMGLRDYQTGTWAGGDAACDHLAARVSDRSRVKHDTYAPPSGWTNRDATPPRQCSCGAIRTDHQIGLEPTIDAYVAALVEVMREVRRVLHDSGVCLINLGDTMAGSSAAGAARSGEYVGDGGVAPPNVRNRNGAGIIHGLPPKSLLMIPARVALALQADGWVLRSMMPWVKRSAMPESVTDRPASAVEYVFLLAKRSRYFWDAAAIQRAATYAGEQMGVCRGTKRRATAIGLGPSGNEKPGADADIPAGRNFRNSDLFYDSLDAPPFGLISDHAGEPLALDVNPEAFPQSHFATYPTRLVDPLIRAATSERGCCAACGGPWARVTERGDLVPTRQQYNKRVYGVVRDAPDANDQGSNRARNGHRANMAYERTTTGWRQSCACPAAPPVPQTVIDPFSGAGTTALCAHRLGRDAIGVELNPDYVAMARARLEADAGMFADVESDVPAAWPAGGNKAATTPRNDGSRWTQDNGHLVAAAAAPLPVPDAAQCELFATLEAAQ